MKITSLTRTLAVLCIAGLMSLRPPPAFAQDATPATSEAAVPAELQQAEIFTYKTVADVSLPLYVFKAEGCQASDHRPAIVFYFGGGWRSGSPTQFATHAQYLASRGMVAICVEYRVQSRHGVNVAQCVADAKSAMRWVRSHAGELGIDPQRIASAGGSAGGHLAAAVALLPGHDDPQDDTSVSCVPDAMVLFNPAVDLVTRRSGTHERPRKGSGDARSTRGGSRQPLSHQTHQGGSASVHHLPWCR